MGAIHSWCWPIRIFEVPDPDGRTATVWATQLRLLRGRGQLGPMLEAITQAREWAAQRVAS